MTESQIANAANLIRAATVYMETLTRVERLTNSDSEADREQASSMMFYAWQYVRDAFDICDADD